MYQICVDKQKLEIKINKMKDSFRGTTAERKASQNPTEIIPYNLFYSFCTSRKLLVEYANSIKEQWLSDAREKVKKIEEIRFN